MTFLLSTWLQAKNRKAAIGARARRGANRSRPHRVVLRLEALEDRMVPSQNGYIQTNLVSDLVSENAQITDPALKNPWGTGHGSDGSFSLADHGTSVSTQYSVTAAGVVKVPLTITIPTTLIGPQGPTGQVTNDTSSFLVNGAPASLIFANLNGTISAWNSSLGTTAKVVAMLPPGNLYTGLDIGGNASGDLLYAANTSKGRIDVFDHSFALANLGPKAFNDPFLPAGLVPFNVEHINDQLYVAYTPAGRPASVAAPEGVGAVAVFDTSGNFIKQLISGGKLAAPWGITLAPSSFGKFGGDLLVGNFSFAASEINAFDPVSGAYQGTLADENGNTLLKDANGLWDLTFGTGGNGGLPGTLYFTTGLNNEVNGLFGAIIPTPENGNAQGSAPTASLTNGYVSHSAIVGIQPIGLLGGDGLGSGVFNGGPTPSASPSLKMEASRVVDNGAMGGVAVTGGSAGQGIGGGIYVTTGGVADAEVPTATDDVFAAFAQR
jgi:uncharacterized protein (TIGR03118 family)